jgi:hypothetical protein
MRRPGSDPGPFALATWPRGVCGKAQLLALLTFLFVPIASKLGKLRKISNMVLPSVEEYQLRRRDRRVVRLEDFTDEEIALIVQAEAPADYSHLDAELRDWRP